MNVNKKNSVLYAEDDENDAFLLQHAFRRTGAPEVLNVLNNGQKTIDYLAATTRKEQPLPLLVLLDLNMPGKSGFDVLEWIRGQASFRTLPIVILTSSNQDRDILRAYDLGANAYLVKPSNPDNFVELTSSVQKFWLELNQTPSVIRNELSPN